MRAHALLVIGASIALPPTTREDLESGFSLLAELVPSVQRGSHYGMGMRETQGMTESSTSPSRGTSGSDS